MFRRLREAPSIVVRFPKLRRAIVNTGTAQLVFGRFSPNNLERIELKKNEWSALPAVTTRICTKNV